MGIYHSNLSKCQYTHLYKPGMRCVANQCLFKAVITGFIYDGRILYFICRLKVQIEKKYTTYYKRGTNKNTYRHTGYHIITDGEHTKHTHIHTNIHIAHTYEQQLKQVQMCVPVFPEFGGISGITKCRVGCGAMVRPVHHDNLKVHLLSY